MRKFEPPLLMAAKWIGIAGAVLIARNVGVVGLGFVLFLIPSVLWTAAAAVLRETSLIVLQGAFAIIDVISIVRWMVV